MTLAEQKDKIIGDLQRINNLKNIKSNIEVKIQQSENELQIEQRYLAQFREEIQGLEGKGGNCTERAKGWVKGVGEGDGPSEKESTCRTERRKGTVEKFGKFDQIDREEYQSSKKESQESEPE